MCSNVHLELHNLHRRTQVEQKNTDAALFVNFYTWVSCVQSTYAVWLAHFWEFEIDGVP